MGFAAVCAILVLTLYPGLAGADPILPVAHNLVGGEFRYTVKRGDTLASISSRYGIPLTAIAAANAMTPQTTLRAGKVLRLDSRHIVPKTVGRGILVNIPQRMLYFFDGGQVASYYPVSLGRRNWPTPVGSFTVVSMRENPTWIVPKSIQREMAARGQEVKTRVPPGPDNPLGHYALDLDIGGCRIHGTTSPLSIYHFATHGCIRLHPADVEDLYKRVAVGETGEIIYEPTLLASLPDGRVFLEVDPDAYKKRPDAMRTVRALAETGNLSDAIDWKAVDGVVRNADSVAREIDRHKERIGGEMAQKNSLNRRFRAIRSSSRQLTPGLVQMIGVRGRNAAPDLHIRHCANVRKQSEMRSGKG